MVTKFYLLSNHQSDHNINVTFIIFYYFTNHSHRWIFVNETNRTRSLSRDKNFEKHKNTFFPLSAKLVFFVCFFVWTKGNVAKNTRKKSDSNSRPLHLLRIPERLTHDLQKKRKLRRTLYLLPNKKESAVLGSFTFESLATNLRHMLGLYVGLRNTRKKLLFLPGHNELSYLFRSHLFTVFAFLIVFLV